MARGEGVIRDPHIHRRILEEVLDFAQKQGFRVRGLLRSPLLGPKGNTEFLAWLDQQKSGDPAPDSKGVTLLVNSVFP